MKTGVVDVGGGLRGIYAAGIFDHCLDADLRFDLCIGVSAGSANIASYLAGQRGRNHTFYTEYAFRKEYMSLRNFLRKRSFVDLDYVYSTLSDAGGEYPLDYAHLAANPAEMIVVATDAEHRRGEVLHQGGRPSGRLRRLQGLLGDPLRLQAVLHRRRAVLRRRAGRRGAHREGVRLGCDRVVLILTKPRDTIRTNEGDCKFADRIQKKYPRAAEQLRLRAEHYNQGVALAKRLEAEGRALILAPDDTCGVNTLTRDREGMERLYEKGLRDAEALDAFLKAR